MLRTVGGQSSLWEAVLPAEALVMLAELAAVDRVLDDPVFVEPYRRHFDWNRTRIDGIQGARTWCGHGVFAHNLIKIAALTA